MQKRVIWLVEDEASIADTLIYALQTDGFEVEWFPLGQPLLARLEQTLITNRPDHPLDVLFNPQELSEYYGW
jgi:DNA-binding response OmpR family regulator